MKQYLWIWLLALPFAVTAGPLEDAGLVDVQTVEDLPVFVSLRYNTTNNFTHKRIYNSSKCYLHKEVIEGLKKAVELASQEEEAFTFCLWDCYRPPQDHQKLWNAKPDPSYVAPPQKGSRHSRGMSVDLTPCYYTGLPLPMPTDFDTFTPRAHMDYPKLPAAILKNRETLKKIMTDAGFTYTRTEWWHFDKTGWQNKPRLTLALPPDEQ